MRETSAPVKMHRLNRGELRLLAEAAGQPSVSLYWPTHRSGREIRQDPIRLKNLISTAADQLRSLGLSDRQTDSVLSFAKSLPESETDEFWQRSSDGMAVFLQDGLSRAFRLPISFDELVVVADRFHIKPLFQYLQGDGHYYVLAVSSNRVRLFEGGRHHLTELPADSLPRSLADALDIDEYQSTLQFHSHTLGGVGGATDDQAIYHGHGGGSDSDKKKELLKYFRELDDGINEFLVDETAPLVFAGVEYLFPIYRQANHYRNLVDKPVAGNHDDASADDLHQPAWDVVKPRFITAREDLREKYGTMAARGQGSDELEMVLRSAREGRVETLLLSEGVRQWGSIADDGSISIADENSAETQDLLDVAAVHTLQNGGDVYLIEADTMPTASPLAAVYRY